jgi:CubicO group peptidase (beta-lactamase class C family)
MRIRYVAVICIFLFFGTTTCLGQSSPAELDSLVQRMMAQEGVVGASVLVARGDKILLRKGYGFADLGLDAPLRMKLFITWLGRCFLSQA